MGLDHTVDIKGCLEEIPISTNHVALLGIC